MTLLGGIKEVPVLGVKEEGWDDKGLSEITTDERDIMPFIL